MPFVLSIPVSSMQYSIIDRTCPLSDGRTWLSPHFGHFLLSFPFDLPSHLAPCKPQLLQDQHDNQNPVVFALCSFILCGKATRGSTIESKTSRLSDHLANGYTELWNTSRNYQSVGNATPRIFVTIHGTKTRLT